MSITIFGRREIPQADRFKTGQRLYLNRLPEGSPEKNLDLDVGGSFTIAKIEEVESRISGASQPSKHIELTITDSRGKVASVFSIHSIFARDAILESN